MSSFYRATPNIPIKSMALAPGASGLILPAWTDLDAWSFNGSSLTQTAVSGAGPVYLVTDNGLFLVTDGGTFIVVGEENYPIGFCGAAEASNGSVWMAQHYGSLINLAPGNGVSSFDLPSGKVFEGVTFVSGFSAPYMMSSDSTIWTLASPSGVQLVSPIDGFASSPAKAMASVGETLYTLLPTVPAVGTYALSTQFTGTSGQIIVPMLRPDSLDASGSNLAVGGWNASTLIGAKALSSDPVVATNVAAASGTVAWVFGETSAGSQNWVVGSGVALGVTPTTLTWAPDGVHIFAASATGLDILQYITGDLTLLQAVSGACGQSSFTTDGLHALMVGGATNEVRTFTFTSSWVEGSPISIAGAASVLGLSPTTAAAGGSAGIDFLTYSGSAWSISSTVATSFVPTFLATDGQGTVFAAGPSGGSVDIAVIASGVVQSTTSYGGSLVDMIYERGQLCCGDATHSEINIFGPVAGSWILQNSFTSPSPLDAVAFNDTTFFAAASGTTDTYIFTAPYRIEQQRIGVVGVYSSGSWNVADLGLLQQPTAVAFNPSGTVTAVTLQNTVYEIGLTGTILSSGVVAQFQGQPQEVPIGLSFLKWWNQHLYAATSLNESLVEVQ